MKLGRAPSLPYVRGGAPAGRLPMSLDASLGESYESFESRIGPIESRWSPELPTPDPPGRDFGVQLRYRPRRAEEREDRIDGI